MITLYEILYDKHHPLGENFIIFHLIIAYPSMCFFLRKQEQQHFILAITFRNYLPEYADMTCNKY